MPETMTLAEYLRLTKQKRRRVDHETPIHLQILHWLEWQFPDAAIHHSPNELDLHGDKKSKARAQQRAKAKGMRPGWPDIEMLWRKQFWTLEVKAEDGRLQSNQAEWGKRIQSQGGKWAVVRSLQEAQAVISEWRAEAGL